MSTTQSDWLEQCSDREQLFQQAGQRAAGKFTVVEVGVYEGDLSQQIAEYCPQAKIYLVDPWRFFPAGYVDPCNRDQDAFDQIFKSVCARMAGYQTTDLYEDHRVIIIRNTSVAAAEIVPNQLDIVYLDGNHSFDGITEDIATWYPKVKPGGILAGHDYVHNPDRSVNGVIPAVDKLVAQHQLKLVRMDQKYDCSWAVRKPI